MRTLRRNSFYSVIVPLTAILMALMSVAWAQMVGTGQRSAQGTFVSASQDAGIQALPHPQLANPERVSASRSQMALGSAESQGPLIFLWPAHYGTSGLVYAATVADVNGDGKPDIVAGYDTTIGVLLGKGDGTFPTQLNSSAGGIPFFISTADLNGDHNPDLVIWGGLGIAVLLGNGDGTFRTAEYYNSGGYNPQAVAIADVNHDGKLDLVVANLCDDYCISGVVGHGEVGVLLGNGDGTFQDPLIFSSSPEEGFSIAVADVNGDGKLDLVAGSICNSYPNPCHDLVSVLLGNGDGSFQPAVTYDSGDVYVSTVAVADLNNDGKADLLAADADTNAVGVMLGKGDGTFAQVVTYDAGAGPCCYSVTAADIDGNGSLDVVTANAWSVSLFLGNGDGTLQQAVVYDDESHTQNNSLIAADLNGDGKPDLVTVDTESRGGQPITVLLNNAGAPPTTTSLVSNVNPAGFKQVVTYTATVTQSGGQVNGPVIFKDGNYSVASVALANNQASFSTSYNHIAVHTITAVYSGDLHKAAGSKSASLTEYIRGATKTSLASSGSPTFIGQPVTFTVEVTSRYGTIPDGELVTFYDGTTVVASVALVGGTATYTTSSLTAKTHGIKAKYSGDTSFAPSSRTVTQVVVKYATTTSLTSSPNPSNYGQTVTFTATVTPSGQYPVTGKVKFFDGATGIGSATVSGGVATLKKSTLAVGTHAITAQYLSDAYNDKSTSEVVNQVIQ